MSTNANIVLVKNEEYHVVYNHYDGYLSYVGEVLFKYYNTQEKVEKLIEGGDIRSFDNGGGVEYFDYEAEDEYKMTVSPQNFKEREYNYFFENGEWLYSTWDDSTKINLEERLKSEGII